MKKSEDNWIYFVVIAIILGFMLFYLYSEHLFKTDKTKEANQKMENVSFEEAVNLQLNSRTRASKSTSYGFDIATEADIRSAMELNNTTPYQFLKLNTKADVTVEELERILKGKGALEPIAETFLQAQNTYDINALYLVSHAILETGHGKSKLAKGIEYNGKRYYNFFGIGAFDHTAISSGSSYAANRNWDSPSKAVMGGAKFIRENYLDQGQVTVYEMRWNPDSPTHNQYATDVRWAIVIGNLMESFYYKLNKSETNFKTIKY